MRVTNRSDFILISSALFHEPVTDSECPDVVIVCAVELSTKGHLSAHGIADPVVPTAKHTGRIAVRCLEVPGNIAIRVEVLLTANNGLRAAEKARIARRGKAVRALQPVAISKNARHQRLSADVDGNLPQIPGEVRSKAIETIRAEQAIERETGFEARAGKEDPGAKSRLPIRSC